VSTSRPIYLLDEDPDLACHLSEQHADEARERLTTPLRRVPEGKWSWGPNDDPEGLGLLLLTGLLWREVTLAGQVFAEPLGSGDLLRPRASQLGYLGDRAGVEWRVEEEVRFGVLDAAASGVVLSYSALNEALIERALARSRSLALQLAINHNTRVDTRILHTLWLLASRWGRVAQEGVVLRSITHEILGRVVGARRPSVTVAVRSLEDEGLLKRRNEGTWILHGEAPAELRDMYGEIVA